MTQTILDLIPFGHDHAISRGELCRLTGKDDRQMRNLIMEQRNQGSVILNMQDGAGYFRPRIPDELDLIADALDAAKGRLYSAQVAVESMEQLLEIHNDLC